MTENLLTFISFPLLMIPKLEDSVFGYVRVDYPEREKESHETEPRFDVYLGPSFDEVKDLVVFVSEQELGARYGEIHYFRLSADDFLLELGKLQEENSDLYHKVMSGYHAYSHHVFSHSAIYFCSTRENTFLGKPLEL